MKIAVASGKGGTGKTTIAVALALSARGRTALLDCDVEEPNAALFLRGTDEVGSVVTVPVPVINTELCTACGQCASFCEFNAIVCIGKTVMAFSELCHSCGGCMRVCPVQAITEKPIAVGSLTEKKIARAGEEPLELIEGLLTIGNAMSPPVIRAVKERAERGQPSGVNAGTSKAERTIILDCPPGTSCPMVTAVGGADYVVLVTEPTPFGLHDLDLAVKTVRKMGLPFGVIVNRSDSGDDRVVAYCEREQIRVLMLIPEDRRIAVGYSKGQPLIESVPSYRIKFRTLVKELSSRSHA